MDKSGYLGKSEAKQFVLDALKDTVDSSDLHFDEVFDTLDHPGPNIRKSDLPKLVHTINHRIYSSLHHTKYQISSSNQQTNQNQTEIEQI